MLLLQKCISSKSNKLFFQILLSNRRLFQPLTSLPEKFSKLSPNPLPNQPTNPPNPPIKPPSPQTHPKTPFPPKPPNKLPSYQTHPKTHIPPDDGTCVQLQECPCTYDNNKLLSPAATVQIDCQNWSSVQFYIIIIFYLAQIFNSLVFLNIFVV